MLIHNRIKKRSYKPLQILQALLITVCMVVILLAQPVAASPLISTNGVRVFVRIEGPNHTIASGHVTAYSCLDALQRLCNEMNVEISLIQNDSGKHILSVGKLSNGDIDSGSMWYTYLERDGRVLENDTILDQILKTNDEVILFFGNSKTTVKSPALDYNVSGSKVVIRLTAEYVIWQNIDKVWLPTIAKESIGRANIRLEASSGTSLTVHLEESSAVTLTIPSPQYYTVSADGYTDGQIPLFVKTLPVSFLAGFADDNEITRAELASLLVNIPSLLVNKTGTPKSGTVATVFTDVTPENTYYNDINRAVSLGLINGYADNTFRPNKVITLMDACVLISRLGIFNEYEDDLMYEGVPSYAKRAVGIFTSLGVLDDIGLPLNSPLTKTALETLVRFILN